MRNMRATSWTSRQASLVVELAAVAGQPMTTNQTNTITVFYRLFRIGLHVLRGVVTAALVYPLANGRQREHLVRNWSRQLLAILHIRLKVHGALTPMPAQGVLLVANHISWADIFLINSAHTAHFISKAEVRDWPIVGWLSEIAGTFFIERARKRDTHRMSHAIQDALKSGKSIAVFPEGTTSDGSKLRHFHTSLLQAAVACGSLIQPVAIRYLHPDGTINTAPAYIDEMSMADSLKRVLGEKNIQAELIFLPPISSHGKTRRELAVEAAAAIASALRLANPHSGTGTPADPPAATQ